MSENKTPFVWVGETAPCKLGDYIVWLDESGITLDGDYRAVVTVGNDTAEILGGASHTFAGLGTFTLTRVEIHPRFEDGGGNRAKFDVDLTPLLGYAG
ncbi:MAG: hypothetical protein LBR58_10005 [Propionibacteriaceae bacterium]|jgi:hypothetical protein|nr:hypothetical protein [Propionibacteriaceae bacterium]